MKHQWNRALITGASSGIGRAMACQLAGEQTDLVVVARDGERLHGLADDLDVDVEVIPADLLDADGVARVSDRVVDQKRPIDLLVNNAGFGISGRFTDDDIDRQVTMIGLNVEALVRLSHAAASAMAPRGRGGILNVSSLAGDLPSPRAAIYGATKAFVTSFSESLGMELAETGVVVTSLRPGLTHTEFHQRADYNTSGLSERLWQSAEEVAAAGLRAVGEGRATTVSGGHNRVAATVVKLAPGGLVRAVTDRVRPSSGNGS
jgi:short-subunit dehydrogenase